MTLTYTITHPDQVILGTHVADVIDAATGHRVAHFRHHYGAGYFSLPIGVPLCTGCDSPTEGDYCAACEEPVDRAVLLPRRLARVRQVHVGERQEKVA